MNFGRNNQNKVIKYNSLLYVILFSLFIINIVVTIIYKLNILTLIIIWGTILCFIILIKLNKN